MKLVDNISGQSQLSRDNCDQGGVTIDRQMSVAKTALLIVLMLENEYTRDSALRCTGDALYFNLGFRGYAGSALLLRHFISFRMRNLSHLVSMQLNEQNIHSFPRQSL